MFPLFSKCFRDWLNEIVKTVLKMLGASDIRGIITAENRRSKEKGAKLKPGNGRKLFFLI